MNTPKHTFFSGISLFTLSLTNTILDVFPDK